LGNGPRILVASFEAFLTSQLWLRNNVSTFTSQRLNSSLFITLAFYESAPIGETILGSVSFKWIIAAVDTPLVYGGVYLVTRSIGKDSFAFTSDEEGWAFDPPSSLQLTSLAFTLLFR